MESKEIISKKEAEHFQQELGELIKEIDFTNPFEVISFANSLIDIGKHFTTQLTNHLIRNGYTAEEIIKFTGKEQ